MTALTLPSPPGEGFQLAHFRKFVHQSGQSSDLIIESNWERFPLSWGKGPG